MMEILGQIIDPPSLVYEEEYSNEYSCMLFLRKESFRYTKIEMYKLTLLYNVAKDVAYCFIDCYLKIGIELSMSIMSLLLNIN